MAAFVQTRQKRASERTAQPAHGLNCGLKMADDTTERLATALRGDIHNARPFAIFDECDADRDGLISSDDFAAGLRRLGLDMDDPAGFFYRLKGDRDASLNYGEFSRGLRFVVREASEAPPPPLDLPRGAAAAAHMPSRRGELAEEMQGFRETMPQAPLSPWRNSLRVGYALVPVPEEIVSQMVRRRGAATLVQAIWRGHLARKPARLAAEARAKAELEARAEAQAQAQAQAQGGVAG